MTQDVLNENERPIPINTRELVKDYYENVGWKRNSNGVTLDSAAWVDQRFNFWVHFSIPRGFPVKGRYLLDAGCGANPRIHLSNAFRVHVCLDFSFRGLFQALLKLDEKGKGVVADITRLPFADNSFDAINCDNVLYHLIPDDQVLALKELYRCTSREGELWISYTTGNDWPLAKRGDRIKNVLRGIPPLLAKARRIRQPRKKGYGRKKELRSTDGAVYSAVPVFEPCTLEWWKDTLKKQNIKYDFRAIGVLSAPTTRRFPKLFAWMLSEGFSLLCRLFPHSMVALSQYYHIRVCKPNHMGRNN